MQTTIVLALDLEGTLISNAMSQIPRPGLHSFLTSCHQLFARIVMFTTVKEPRFRSIAHLLVQEGYAPDWFADIEFVHWAGATKDLSFVPNIQPQRVWLVDDFERYIHPGQEQQWMPVQHFDHPYDSADKGLEQLLERLQQRLKVSAANC